MDCPALDLATVDLQIGRTVSCLALVTPSPFLGAPPVGCPTVLSCRCRFALCGIVCWWSSQDFNLGT